MSKKAKKLLDEIRLRANKLGDELEGLGLLEYDDVRDALSRIEDGTDDIEGFLENE